MEIFQHGHSDNGLCCSKPKAVFGMQSCPTPSIESLTKSIYSNLPPWLLHCTIIYGHSQDRSEEEELKDKALSGVILNNGWANSREPKLRLELRNDTRGCNLNGGVIRSHSRDWSGEVVWAVRTWTMSLATMANPFHMMHSSNVNLKQGLSYDVHVRVIP